MHASRIDVPTSRSAVSARYVPISSGSLGRGIRHYVRFGRFHGVGVVSASRRLGAIGT